MWWWGGSLDAEESGLYALDDKMLLKSFQQKRINEYPPGIFHRLCEGGVGRKRLLLRLHLLLFS